MDYKEKKKEIEEKYVEPIKAIAVANDVDMGVAYEMFKTNITQGGKYQYAKFNEEEAKKDFEELIELAKQN